MIFNPWDKDSGFGIPKKSHSEANSDLFTLFSAFSHTADNFLSERSFEMSIQYTSEIKNTVKNLESLR